MFVIWRLVFGIFLAMEQALSVHEFLAQLNEVLHTQVVLIQGEVTRVDSRGGYTFFTLKDKEEEAVLSCFMWERSLAFAGFTLEEGAEVQVMGYPEVYIRSGRFNFHVERLMLVGEGALQKAFLALKKQLEMLGFFAPERKKAIPRFVRRIGLITSAFGDAKKDFLTHVGAYGLHIQAHDVKVESMYAVNEIVEALRYFNEQPQPVDVLVLIRGGGSLESLQAFNSEAVARAIFASKIPVLTGIGHEADFTIADFVSDLRASTPTHAARILSDPWREAAATLQNMSESLATSMKQTITRTKDDLATHESSLEEGLKDFFARIKDLLRNEAQKLALASPENRLRQGYSITRDASTRKVVKKKSDVSVGQELVTVVYQGEINSKVL